MFEWLARLLVAVGASCQHVDSRGRSRRYREYRTATGRPLGVAERQGTDGVLHLVCERCGDAVPAVARTAGEQAEILRGRGHGPKARRALPPQVEQFAQPQRRDGVRHKTGERGR